ncbi:MAG: tRNA (adenosine(37)-N6)-threonylcarbamoyltransferase complex ATPase subunit type 1 TsaE [Firmicutes bacterium]|nr:tRNA (adenosine(37)-N6)-threonylcarbamoyltransferase complex ATPase subunit type 1 TsaE [Bacillota bacterium]
MWQRRICHAEEMRRLGEYLGQILWPGAVICLSGELGAGKTVLAQGVAKGAGVGGYVTSPTFTLVHEYQGEHPVYHLDVYRLDDPAEFAELGFREYLGGDGIAIVEWPERILEYLPQQYLLVEIKRDEHQADCRLVTIKPVGDDYHVVLEELEQRADFGY